MARTAKTVSVSLAVEVVETLDFLCERLGLSRSQAVSMCICRYADKEYNYFGDTKPKARPEKRVKKEDKN